MAELPKRSKSELIDALRARASMLTGAEWERTATADMMREAADMLSRGCSCDLEHGKGHATGSQVDDPYPVDRRYPNNRRTGLEG